ncbi:hypothetical protein [Actinoplanes xinjiangensis]|uniref:hypothetical protein n=1 Tax=Actinoplanes xinjiangensis TaxID=512350 RepID=UPI001EF1841E|nr:hypothetical protein [Actinoplanes xinjiangensis]
MSARRSCGGSWRLPGVPGPHVPVAPHTPLVDFEAIAADYPVFQISRRSGAS